MIATAVRFLEQHEKASDLAQVCRGGFPPRIDYRAAKHCPWRQALAAQVVLSEIAPEMTRLLRPSSAPGTDGPRFALDKACPNRSPADRMAAYCGPLRPAAARRSALATYHKLQCHLPTQLQLRHRR
jgi:hypothetical protein